LKKNQVSPYALLSIRDLNMNTLSALGGNFTINVEEFINLARTYFYLSPQLLFDMRTLLTSLNLSLSHLYSYQVYLKGLQDFVLSIGKTRMRENLRHNLLIMENRAFSTSLFNLVTPDAITEAEIKKEGFIVTNQNKLARFLIEVARPLTRRIAGIEKVSMIRP
jgi:hypothetical protein